MTTERAAPAVITGLGTAVRGLDGPAGLLGPLPAGHRSAADPVSRLTGRGLRYKDRATKLAMAAARDALAEAGLTDPAGEPTVPGESTGVVASTNYGNCDTVCETVATIAESTYLATSPMLLPATSSNVVASWVAITHGLRGANLTGARLAGAYLGSSWFDGETRWPRVSFPWWVRGRAPRPPTEVAPIDAAAGRGDEPAPEDHDRHDT